MAKTSLSRREFLELSAKAAGAAAVVGSGVLGSADWLHAQPSAGPTSGGMSEEQLQSVLGELVADIRKKAPYASGLYTEFSGLTVSTFNGEKSGQPFPKNAGVVFRAYDGASFREVATSTVTRDGLRRAAKELKDGIKTVATNASAIPEDEPAEMSFVSTGYVAPDAISQEGWRTRANELYAMIKESDSRIVSASGAVRGFWNRKIFVDENRKLRQSTLRAGVRCFAFAKDGDHSGRTFFQNLNYGELDVAELSQERLAMLVAELNATFGAGRIPPGEYRIVTTPAITGLLAHESFGHGVEYDQFIKGRARAAQFLGKRVSPEFVQIYDDPSYDGQNGSYFFDDEGMGSKSTQIMRDGIFERPITDLFSSMAGNAERTPNGRRQSYAHKAYARMSNTFFGRGETPVTDVIGAVDDGILVEGFSSGMEDPHGWGIQLTCRLGHEIKNGELTGKTYAPIGVGGYVPDILGSITHVGDDFELDPGTCGKGHKEYVPVGSGGPHMAMTAKLS